MVGDRYALRLPVAGTVLVDALRALSVTSGDACRTVTGG